MENLNNLQNFDGLVQEKRNSSALAAELQLSCINPSISSLRHDMKNKYKFKIQLVIAVCKCFNDINGSVQYCGNSNFNVMNLLPSCT